MSFNPNWICRAELEVVEIEPALLVFTTVFGNAKCASLKRLKNSERKSSAMRSCRRIGSGDREASAVRC